MIGMKIIPRNTGTNHTPMPVAAPFATCSVEKLIYQKPQMTLVLSTLINRVAMVYCHLAFAGVILTVKLNVCGTMLISVSRM